FPRPVDIGEFRQGGADPIAGEKQFRQPAIIEIAAAQCKALVFNPLYWCPGIAERTVQMLGVDACRLRRAPKAPKLAVARRQPDTTAYLDEPDIEVAHAKLAAFRPWCQPCKTDTSPDGVVDPRIVQHLVPGVEQHPHIAPEPWAGPGYHLSPARTGQRCQREHGARRRAAVHARNTVIARTAVAFARLQGDECRS